jgi:signal transduction histidine kinase/ActR/RegA family two-component response regulator
VSRLKTARVPEPFEEEFVKAEEVVSRYFEQRVEDPTHGHIEIAGERYLLMRAASLSVEFFALVEKLFGAGRHPEAHDFARNILFDLAHAVGKSDAENFHEKMKLDDPLARLSAGPIHFAHAGWAFVDIAAESKPVPGPDFSLLYDHPYSFEADAWISAGRRADFPVCIMNAGYSSGWCEASFAMPLVASEVLCRARGDECCRFIMARPEEIEQQVEQYMTDKPSLAARIRGYQIPDFFQRKRVEEELRGARDDLEQRVSERTTDLREANDRLQREMTKRQRIQRQLEKTQRLESLGRLAGGVAHDFNNLLGVILGYSSLLQRRVPSSDPMNAMLSEITHAAQLAADLTRQLLTFSRRQFVAPTEVEMNEVVTGLSKMLRRLVGDDVVIDTQLAAGSTRVGCDGAQLEQVVMNLVVNARDAMPDGGKIVITTMHLETAEGQPPFVCLCVADDGVGMDADTRKRIFDPFFTTKEGGEGTGLGLSTVYGIVSQHGGAVTVESEPGAGTTFRIELPLAVAPRRERVVAEVRSHRARYETLLLVEDRVSFRALVAELLGDMGYHVLVADDGGSALALAEQHHEPIDALITDVQMPGIGGRRLADELSERRPGLRVLFMSGYADDPRLLGDLRRSHRRFIAKPFTAEELDSELRRLLDEDV